MGNALLTRMASGIQGALSRQDSKTIEAVPYGATAFPTYGVPVKYVAGLAVPIGAADVAASVRGFLLRPYPVSGGGSAQGSGTPATTGIANVLRRGYISVVCNAGTPALDGAVYVRIDTPSGAKVVGGIEAAADSTHVVLLTNATFNGPADASGNCEIAFNI